MADDTWKLVTDALLEINEAVESIDMDDVDDLFGDRLTIIKEAAKKVRHAVHDRLRPDLEQAS